jgi:hypothetical protein
MPMIRKDDQTRILLKRLEINSDNETATVCFDVVRRTGESLSFSFQVKRSGSLDRDRQAALGQFRDLVAEIRNALEQNPLDQYEPLR